MPVAARPDVRAERESPMSEPVTPVMRPARPPLSIALMFVACLMMLAAFLLLSTGAVAETPPEVGRDAARGAVECDATHGAVAELRQARAEVVGHYVVDDHATPGERTLGDGVRASRSGAGFATGAEITLVVEGAPRSLAAADPNASGEPPAGADAAPENCR